MKEVSERKQKSSSVALKEREKNNKPIKTLP